jgi:hypothetical protein
VPDHRKVEALVILKARQDAAIEKVNRLLEMSKMPLSPGISIDLLIGEF